VQSATLPRMLRSSSTLAVVLLLACGLDFLVGSSPLVVLRRAHSVPADDQLAIRRSVGLWRLRGGADAELDEEEEEDEDGDDDTAVAATGGDALQNPFLDTGGLPGMPSGPGIEDLAAQLKDPKALQDALKELQDPAVQQQVRQMLEDPTFQQSMKQYMEQITKDPQFAALKEQTEAMLQEEGFVESMTKAFSEMGIKDTDDK